jgi:hypothetical protein
MKFRDRLTTAFLQVVFKETQANSIHELRSEARRKGDLDVDFHFIIQKDGTVEEGRAESAVGHYSLEDPERTLSVFVNAPNARKMTDAQKYSYLKLLETYSELQRI